jgi:hypothetical protein
MSQMKKVGEITLQLQQHAVIAVTVANTPDM